MNTKAPVWFRTISFKLGLTAPLCFNLIQQFITMDLVFSSDLNLNDLCHVTQSVCFDSWFGFDYSNYKILIHSFNIYDCIPNSDSVIQNFYSGSWISFGSWGVRIPNCDWDSVVQNWWLSFVIHLIKMNYESNGCWSIWFVSHSSLVFTKNQYLNCNWCSS